SVCLPAVIAAVVPGAVDRVAAQTPATGSAATQQAEQRSPIQPPPAPAGPAPLGVSGQLAPWLQVRGEYRARIEGFDGGGFSDTEDSYWMGRFRINASVQPTKTVRFVAQLQDSRAFDKTTGQQAVPLRDTLDLRMAYGEYTS